MAIDKKDKQILFHLLENSRQSYKSIGKKVGTSKELVSYRINRMVINKIILNNSIMINFERLGYALMQTHYKFITVNPQIKKEIIDFLVANKHTMYVGQIEGIYDLQIEFYIGRPNEFEQLLDIIRKKYHTYFSFKVSKLPIRAEFYNYSFLVGRHVKKKIDVNWIWGQQPFCIDSLDFEILKELSKDCRIPITILANKLSSTVSTIHNRIKKLENETIIVQYTTNVDWSKLGYKMFHLQIQLQDYTKMNEIINYMRNNPYLIRRFKFIDLDMDLHFTLLLHNMDQLRAIMEDISNNFPNAINTYQFYSTFKVHKYNFFIPELLTNKNLFNKSSSF